MKFLLIVLFAIPSAVLRGYVLKVLWGWFIVPQFHVAPLRIPVALGISGLVALLTADTSSKHESRESWESLVIAVFISLFAWGMGWIYQLFM
jgi:hypothetical protein